MLTQVILMAVFILIVLWLFRKRLNGLIKLSIILIIGMLVRAFIAYHFYGTGDVQDFEKIMIHTVADKNFYAAGLYNYPPLMPWLWDLLWMINPWEVKPIFLIKTFTSFSDLFTALLIFYVCRKKMNLTSDRALLHTSLFFLNPISIMITSYHGQIDSFCILFLMLAWVFFVFTKGTGCTLYSALALSISIAFKHVTILLMPVFLIFLKDLKKRVVFLVFSCLPPTLMLLPYFLESPEVVIERLIGRHSAIMNWGYTQLVKMILSFIGRGDLIEVTRAFFGSVGQYILLVVLLLEWLFVIKKVDVLKAILIVFLTFYSVTAGFGWQYLAWILPFWAVRPSRLFILFTSIGTLYLFMAYLHYYSAFDLLYPYHFVAQFFWMFVVFITLRTLKEAKIS